MAAALALVSVVIFMLVVDSVSVDYEASPFMVASVLGCAAALLGVEIVDFIQKRGGKG